LTGVFKIGVVSQKTGLSVATLRLWEEQYGLLAPQRSGGGTRLYSDADVERVLYIKSLVRDRGYTLRAVAGIIDEARSGVPAAPDRVAVENLYLQAATNREHIEEGRRMAQVHGLLRRIVRAESAWHAAVTLVEGIKTLTGAHTSSLGLFHGATDSLSFVATLRGSGIQRLARPPLPLSSFPLHWQQALRAREPYSDPDLLRLDLPGSITSRLSEDRTRSFHAEPLSIGTHLVGVLIIGSAQPGGIGRDARLLCERVAVPAGAAIHYHAASF
jgi:DNA-binding transcriptional MerR regulator